MGERSTCVAGRMLCLGGREFVEQFELLLQLGIVGHRHDDHIPFTVSGDEDRFISRVRQVRDLVGLVAEIGNRFDDGHECFRLGISIY